MLGLIGTKIGMTQVFDESGVLSPATVIKIEDNFVVGKRTNEDNGYEACVLGAIERKESKVSKAYAGQFKNGMTPKRYVREVRDFDLDCEVGDKLGAEVFQDFTYVDVIGTSKGKGYQGVMKRHNFGGGRKTHGSKFHRANGSTGMAAWPSRVIKGTKMPGRMGADKVTVQNLEIITVDTEKGVLILRGAVPGHNNGMVFVQEAKKG